MEQCLHNWFVRDGQLISSCDFAETAFQGQKPVYEVVRVMNGRVLFEKEHLDRFESSAKLAGFALPERPAIIAANLRQMITVNKVHEGNIKLVAACGEKTFVSAWFIPYAYPSPEMARQGITVAVIDIERATPNIKLQDKDYKNAVQQAIADSKVYEVLISRQGLITEGSRSNVFFIQGESLVTAPDEMVLKGITRDKVLALCAEKGVEVVFRTVHTAQLQECDAAFITGTSPKVLAISEVKGHAVLDVDNALLRNVAGWYDALVEAQ